MLQKIISQQTLLTKHFIQNQRSIQFFRNMSSSNSTVLTEETKNVGVIILNRPKALNAINLEMVQSIYAHLKKWETTKSLVLIKGVGDKSFCAGGDVRAIVEAGPTPKSKQFFRDEYTLNYLIGTYKIPYIALLDGITMGGGVGLSVHGKYRIATERSMFAMPETAIGLFPDVGGSHFLPRLTGKLGLYLGLTGYRLKGEDVLKSGIATHYCESSKLLELEKTLLNAKGSEVSDILSKFSQPSSKKFVLSDKLDIINKFFSGNSVEEIMKNLDDESSSWSENTWETLKKLSPLSLKITFEQLKRAANLSLAECLKMEYRMVVRHLEDSDFKEGVRALLIDKDQKPNWNPSKLKEVTNDRVQSFFAELPSDEELNL